MPRIQKILEGIASSNRVAGAYLFLGPPGPEKKAATEYFTGVLSCPKQDVIAVSPSGATFKIDQVRELQEWTKYGPSAGKYLVAIVDQADTMTDQAAAAFLKTLEEPAPGVVFILLVDREDKIPVTIVSRCQRLIFPEPEQEWQQKPANSQLYGEIKGIKKCSRLELFKLAARLEKEKERLEELLYDLAYFVRHELLDIGATRVILEALYRLKRRANARLVLDLMCWKLAKAGGKNV
jgi:DNA polymerase III delta prime subunit